MNIGRTATVHFSAKIVGLIVGFVGSIYFAREVGAAVLGMYFLVLAILTPLLKFGNIGVRTAVIKKLSEDGDSRYVSAGLLLQTIILLIFSLCIVVVQDHVNDYVGTDATIVLIVLLTIRTTAGFIFGVLDGEKSVALSSVLESVGTTSRVFAQSVGIFLGFGFFGLVAGYGIGTFAAILIGFYFVTTRFSRPKKEQIYEIAGYLKYAWLGGVRNVSYAWMDTLVLGLFVSSSLVGIYEISWMISTVLSVAGTSISRTVFPEISDLSAGGEIEDISRLVTLSVSFAGLLLIPGLVGGMIIGDTILLLYGKEFVAGGVVLLILILARLCYAYQQQFITALNAIDRPDLTFRISAAFTVVNIGLNFALVSTIGWIGAAIATATSAGIGLILSYGYLYCLVDFDFPIREIGKQWVAAVIMGAIILVTRNTIGSTTYTVIPLVLLGAAVYVSTLAAISQPLRNLAARTISLK